MTEIINLPKVRIIGKSGNDAKIFLDDIDITRFVNRIEFVLDCIDLIPIVKLTIVAMPEIPENLQAVILGEEFEVELEHAEIA